MNELSTSRTGPYQILALSGSLRAVSSNALAIEAVAALAPATLQVSIYRGLNELPHFNPDLDTDELRPLAASHWRARARGQPMPSSSPVPNTPMASPEPSRMRSTGLSAGLSFPLYRLPS